MTGLRIALARCDQGAMKLLVYAEEKVRGAISLMSAPAGLYHWVVSGVELVLGAGVWSGNSTSKSFLTAGNDDCADVFVRVVGG